MKPAKFINSWLADERSIVLDTILNTLQHSSATSHSLSQLIEKLSVAQANVHLEYLAERGFVKLLESSDIYGSDYMASLTDRGKIFLMDGGMQRESASNRRAILLTRSHTLLNIVSTILLMLIPYETLKYQKEHDAKDDMRAEFDKQKSTLNAGIYTRDSIITQLRDSVRYYKSRLPKPGKFNPTDLN
jgi:uncharacterized membrane protein